MTLSTSGADGGVFGGGMVWYGIVRHSSERAGALKPEIKNPLHERIWRVAYFEARKRGGAVHASVWVSNEAGYIVEAGIESMAQRRLWIGS